MKKSNEKSGFTLVELLIVIVVIAILASISVVAYRGIQNRTHDSIIKSDMSSVAKQLAVYRVENGSYVPSSPWDSFYPDIKGVGMKVSTNSYKQFVYLSDPAGSVYGLVAQSKSGNMFCYSVGLGAPKDCSSQLTGVGFPDQGLGRFKTFLDLATTTGQWANGDTSGWADWVQ